MAPFLEVELFREEGGLAPGHVKAAIVVDGSLEVEVKTVARRGDAVWQDIGQKSWLKVPSSGKDLLLLALIKKAYGGRVRGVDELRDFLIDNGLQHSWESQA
jgi:hypothetical protein